MLKDLQDAQETRHFVKCAASQIVANAPTVCEFITLFVEKHVPTSTFPQTLMVCETLLVWAWYSILSILETGTKTFLKESGVFVSL